MERLAGAGTLISFVQEDYFGLQRLVHLTKLLRRPSSAWPLVLTRSDGDQLRHTKSLWPISSRSRQLGPTSADLGLRIQRLVVSAFRDRQSVHVSTQVGYPVQSTSGQIASLLYLMTTLATAKWITSSILLIHLSIERPRERNSFIHSWK